MWTAISIIGCTVGGGLIGAALGLTVFNACLDPHTYQTGGISGVPVFEMLCGAMIGATCGGLLGAFGLGREEESESG